MNYRAIDPAKIVKTLRSLESRIEERFPGRGINEVCHELVEISLNDAGRAKAMGRPFYLLRLSIWLVLISGLASLVWGAYYFRAITIETGSLEAFSGIEALINITILTGAGLWFLLNLESRIKRGRILNDLHTLRSLAHVIDMHQLTKDPTVLLAQGPSTPSSPERGMSEFELTRYLDYCAEMLSLIGKLAALYAENVKDPVTIDAVNKIEALTSDLARKIWQKITILGRLDESRN